MWYTKLIKRGNESAGGVSRWSLKCSETTARRRCPARGDDLHRGRPLLPGPEGGGHAAVRHGRVLPGPGDSLHGRAWFVPKLSYSALVLLRETRGSPCVLNEQRQQRTTTNNNKNQHHILKRFLEPFHFFFGGGGLLTLGNFDLREFRFWGISTFTFYMFPDFLTDVFPPYVFDRRFSLIF